MTWCVTATAEMGSIIVVDVVRSSLHRRHSRSGGWWGGDTLSLSLERKLSYAAPAYTVVATCARGVISAPADQCQETRTEIHMMNGSQ